MFAQLYISFLLLEDEFLKRGHHAKNTKALLCIRRPFESQLSPYHGPAHISWIGCRFDLK